MDELLADDVRRDDNGGQADQPDEMLEIARNILEKQRSPRATAIWERLAAGESGPDAWIEVADYLIRELPDERETDAAMELLARNPTSGLGWMWATALHERRGQYMLALIMYSRAAEDLTAERIAQSRAAQLVINGRRRAKWALGIKPDSLDQLGEAGAVEATDNYLDFLDLFREPPVRHGKVNVWSRSELELAQETWPPLVTASSITDYYREIERTLRAHDGRVIIELQTFGVAETETPLTAPADSDDHTVRATWPPGRNELCWCGSGIKYKRCCGGSPLPDGVRLAWGPARLRAGAELAVCRV